MQEEPSTLNLPPSTNNHCPQCGSSNDLDAAFCENCGAKLERLCTQCGAALKPGARFCKLCGAPVPSPTGAERLQALRTTAPPELQEKIRLASQQVQGERKPVTILFTDIVGSTSLAEKLDPEEWKEIVSGAHQRVSQAVYRYEGTIAQLLGDGVLAFFGAPVIHEDDPLRAARAALDIQYSIAEYERQLKGYLDGFQIRIGLNTGIVVVGSVGSDLHMEYLAIGDAVNLAARLQSAAQPGKVLLSESTARLVQAAFTLQPLGQINLKGKSEPVAVFELVQSKTAPESRRGFEELRSPLVGRQAELSALRRALQQLGAGLGQIVSLTGEAGIGKSRLVEEARSPLASPNGYQNLHWLEGRALSYGQQLSFWTIRQLLFSDLGASDGDPEPRLRLALRKRVGALFGGEAGELLPYLGNLLGLRLEDEQAERVKDLDGETLKHQTLLSITRYFTRLAEMQPAVLVFDDLHWADPSSLEALEGLLPLTDRVPLLLLLLSRLEREHPSWQLKLKAASQYAHRYTDITIQPLSGVEQNQLVDNLLAITDLPLPVRRRILETAEGNPLFLEEIVRHLIDQRAIVRQGEGWQAAGDLLNVSIPDTLRGVLLARIDRLQEDVRRTLQLAAVIGKSFLYRLLEAIAEAEAQLDRHLAQLQRSDLVREKTRLPELEYMFKHSLTQEAAYQSLLLEQRREFHRRVGQALEQLFAGREEEYFGLLAHHFDAAGEAGKAITYLIQAGDKARLSDEHLEAVAYYQRALELLSEAGDESRAARAAQVWLKLGLVYHASFQFESTYQAYENAFALSQKFTRLTQASLPAKGKPLRLIMDNIRTDCYDPGKAGTRQETEVIMCLFSGLVRVDEALNVVPDVARSWQVLEGGKRYRFHLRQDVRWTDGTPVTAHDFEWAWKRNLVPSFSNYNAQLLYSVAGAQDYHEGRNADPESVGVRALDAWTLQVDLVKPVAYFPFLMAQPDSCPLPRATVERYGEDWWHAEHIVSNGAFRLVEYDPAKGLVMERNPGYHGEFSGNVQRIEMIALLDPTDPLEGLRTYQGNRTDITLSLKNQVPADLPAEEMFSYPELFTLFVQINPLMPPFHDARLRGALSLTLDRAGLFKKLGIPAAQGGIIPPGMPGHSPTLGLGYDPVAARRLLAEAGFPDSAGLPVINVVTYPQFAPILSEIISQWHQELGLQVEVDYSDRPDAQLSHCAFVLVGWVADLPDPDNFLRQSNAIIDLKEVGWQDQEYEALVETALSLSDRSERMRLYRQADRLLVAERVLSLPVGYSKVGAITLVKPWVKNFKINLLGQILFNQIVVEEP